MCPDIDNYYCQYYCARTDRHLHRYRYGFKGNVGFQFTGGQQYRMLQKRREAFRQEIRRKHLDSIIREARIKLIQSNNFATYLESFAHGPQGIRVTSILQAISTAIKQSDKAESDKLFVELLTIVEKEPVQTSTCLIILAKRVNQVMGNIINNRNVIAQGDREWTTIDPQLQTYAIYQFMNVFSKMNFNELRVEQFTIFAQSFWPLFCDEGIDVCSVQNLPILPKLLKTIKQILLSNNKTAITVLRQLNLSSQLAEILKKSASFSKQCVVEMAEILHVHLRQEDELDCLENRCQINGITIVGVESEEHKAFALFCFKIIRKKIEEGLLPALSVLVLIFNRHPHLTSQADQKLIRDIATLIKTPPIRIQKLALELLCDMLTIELEIGDDLLEKNFCLDILCHFLQAFSGGKGEGQECSYIVGCIVSNLTLSTSRLGKELLLHHKIWKLILQHCTHPSSPFLPLIATFEYFFFLAGEKQAGEVLDAYLYNVSCLDLKMVAEREATAIRQTVQRVFYRAANEWEKAVTEKLRRMVGHYRLQYLLEESEMQQEGEMGIERDVMECL